MRKFEKAIIGITSLLMGLVLVRFTISKLAGWEISVNAFIEMAKPLGINPTFFRVFTGILILLVVVLYFTTVVFALFETKLQSYKKLNFISVSTYSNTLGLLTMVGALLAEFYLRVQPKWLLVYIAAAIVIFSAINLLIIKKQQKQLTQITI
jgi:hypothetical protein